MGVYYAIVHEGPDGTREAYSLGKNGGWQWRPGNTAAAEEDGCPWPPTSRDQLHEFFLMEYAQYDWAPADGIARLADEVWAFVQSHPGCRVENDMGDVTWMDRNSKYFRAERLKDPEFYVEVGDLYDALGKPSQPNAEEQKP